MDDPPCLEGACWRPIVTGLLGRVPGVRAAGFEARGLWARGLPARLPASWRPLGPRLAMRPGERIFLRLTGFPLSFFTLLGDGPWWQAGPAWWPQLGG